MRASHVAPIRLRLTCLLAAVLMVQGCAGGLGGAPTGPDVNLLARGPGKGGTAVQPTISAFSPASGTIGDTVRIDGSNFTRDTLVFFNGTQATATLVSATQLNAVVPAGAATGPITVTNGLLSATTPTPFTVTTAPVVPATLTRLEPAVALPGATLMIEGVGFSDITANNVVRVGGVQATVLPSSTTHALFVTVPATVAAGATTVTVGTSAPLAFEVGASSEPLPTIASVSPLSGAPGATVTLTGSNFTDRSVVTFNGEPATVSSRTATSLSVVVPAGATSGPVKVENKAADGTAGPAAVGATFTVVSTVLPPPTAAGFTMFNASEGAIVQMRTDRLRMEVTADTGVAGTCAPEPGKPTVAALFTQMTFSTTSGTYNPKLGLRGHATCYRQLESGERGESIVPEVQPEGRTIDVLDMVVPPDETEVAVGNDRAGHVLEVIFMPPPPAGSPFPQLPPIVRVELTSWVGTLLRDEKLILDWDLQTYDKLTGKTLQQWNGSVKDILVP